MQFFPPSPIFTREFVSTPQVIVPTGVLILPHGFAVRPKLVRATLVCGVAELNYTVGDYVDMSPGPGPGATEGMRVVANASDVNVRFGTAANVFSILNRVSGVLTPITPGSWSLVMSAFA